MAQLLYPSNDKPPIPLRERTVVGRSSDHSDAVINDKRLSRSHAEILRRGSGWVVRDMESANGIKVNGETVKESPLKEGDEISFGGLPLVFSLASAASDEIDLGVEIDLDSPASSKAASPATVIISQASVSSVSKQKPPVLKLIRGNLRKVLVSVDAQPFVIGRKEGCNLILDDDKQASGHHARIERTGDGSWRVVDLNSTNGTKVNGQQVTEAALADGAQLQIGSQSFRFYQSGVATDDAPAAESAGGDGLVFEGAELGADAASKQAAGSTGPKTEIAPLKAAPELPGAAPVPVHGTDEDRAAVASLDAKVVDKKGSGGGKWAVRILEIVIGLIAVAGLVGVLYVLLTQEKIEDTTGTTTKVFAPAGTGGLLNGPHSSFEPDQADVGGLPKWTTELTRYDQMFGFEDGGKGGRQVLRASRSGFTPRQAKALCLKPFEAEGGKGYRASVWAKMPEGAGTGFISVSWHESLTDPAPLRVDVRGFLTGAKDWTEIVASLVAPPGTKAGRIAVGIAGRTGEVWFDQAAVVADTAAKPVGDSAASGALFMLGDNGLITIGGGKLVPGVSLFGNGSVWLVRPGSNPAEMALTEWLVDAPSASDVAGRRVWLYRFFDPDAGVVREYRLSIDNGRMVGELGPAPGSAFTRAELRLSPSSKLVPAASDAAVFASVPKLGGGQQDGDLRAYGRQVNVAGQSRTSFTNSELGVVLTTASGIASSPAQFMAFGDDGKLDIGIEVRDDLQRMVDLRGQLDGSSRTRLDPPTQLSLGLELASRAYLDEKSLRLAASAVSSASTSYRIRRAEIDDTILSGTATARNADRYVAAVAEAQRLAAEIAGKLGEWRELTRPLSGLSASPLLPEQRVSLLRQIVSGVDLVSRVQPELSATASSGEVEAFGLRAARQRMESDALFAGAVDHLNTDEKVQARLRLLDLIRRFPDTHNAARARSYLLQLCADLLADHDRFKAESLTQIAAETADKVRALLATIQSTSQAATSADVIGRLRRSRSAPADLDEWDKLERDVAARATALSGQLEQRLKGR